MPPGECTWWMMLPAALSPPGRSRGSLLSPAAPARERSSLGAVLWCPEVSLPSNEAAPRAARAAAAHPCPRPFSLPNFTSLKSITRIELLSLLYKRKIVGGKFLQALVKSRVWLNLLLLMRWLSADPGQGFSSCSWNPWAHADTWSPGLALRGLPDQW